MRVLMHGTIVDGPMLADTEDGAITATFTYADTTGTTPFALPRACCDVICHGALAVTVLLDLRAGADVCIDGELRLHRPLCTGDDEDLVLATVHAHSITPRIDGCCPPRIGHAVDKTCF
jgi:hypothetical protein